MNCTKLTHLSLTGVQAFLREDLLAFCRDAPPEFNEHQRDVFCVFSNNGVTKLRTHLNQQKIAEDAAALEAGSTAASAGDNIANIHELGNDSLGNNPSVMYVDVHGGFPQGSASNARPSPPMPLPYGTAYQHVHPHTHHSLLSQSAPATTGGAAWAGGGTPVMINTSGGAQHVTGMMGATILDDQDVDEDDAFGEGSELME
jgi:F-box and leucine-rich repeat protein GRR1